MAYSIEQWDRAKAYFESGQYSLSQISDKVGINKSNISRKSKTQQWVQGKNSDYIKAKTTIATKKATENATTMQVLDDIADETIRHNKLINDNATKLANKLNAMTDEVDQAQDLKYLVDANDKLAITLKVADRHAPKIELNNTNAQQNNITEIEITRIEANISLLAAQDDFVHDDNPFPALVGGLGSGKSEGGIVRLIIKLIKDRGANGAYYMPTYDLLRLRAITGFENVLNKLGLSYRLNKSESTIYIDGYGFIIFRSYDRPERIVAYEVAHSIVDEIDTLPIDKASYVWRKITERNRQKINSKNTIGVVTTPDNGVNGFVYDKWVKKKQVGYSLTKASTYNNPFLPSDYINNILNNYDPIMADLYLKGEFVSLNQNKIYHFFDRKKHHTNRVLESHDKFIYVGQDFNICGCTSSVWIIENNTPIMVDELISHDTYDLINNLKSRYRDKVIEIFPDASGNHGSTNATQTDISLLSSAGFLINAPSGNPAVRDRINSVNGLLSHDNFMINTDKCQEHTHALENQGYDTKGNPEKWNTHPAIDDFNDDMGYFINQKFGINKSGISQQGISYT